MRCRRRVSRDVTMNNATVVMIRVVARVSVQMDEGRSQRAHLQADAHEPDEAETFHLFGIVAHRQVRVKEGVIVLAL